MGNYLQVAFDQVNLNYAGFDELALKKLTLHSEINKVGLIGPSHAGKSTLLYLLAGVLDQVIPTEKSGTIALDGQDLVNWLASKQIGLVLQDPASQLSGMADTVFDEIAFGLYNQGLEEAEIEKRVQAVAQKLDLEDFLDQAPTALSGGQIQRLAIASIIALKPDLLLLDDPTSQMDPLGRQHFFAWLKELDCPVIIASSEVDDLAEVCDQLWVIEDGELQMIGKPADIFMKFANDHEIAKPAAFLMGEKMGYKFDGHYPVTADELMKAAAYGNHD